MAEVISCLLCPKFKNKRTNVFGIVSMQLIEFGPLCKVKVDWMNVLRGHALLCLNISENLASMEIIDF